MSSDREFLVLQVSPDELRLGAVRASQDRAEVVDTVTYWCRSAGPESLALKDETILDAMAEYVRDRGWAGRELVVVLGGSSVSCQHYEMPPLKGAALRQAVMLKLAQQLHFDVQTSVVSMAPVASPRVAKKGQQQVDIAVLSRDVAAAAIDAAARARLVLTAVSISPCVIGRICASRRAGMSGFSAVLHLDERVSTLVVLDDDRPFVTSELPIGVTDLTTALMRPIISGDNVIQLDEAAATKLRNEIGIPEPETEIPNLGVTGDRILPLIEPAIQKFGKQLTQWLTFAATCNGGIAIANLTLVGPGGRIRGIAPALQARVSATVESVDWLEDWTSFGPAIEETARDSLAVIAGGAKFFRELPDLRTPEFKRECAIRKVRRNLVVGGPALAAGIFGIGVLFSQIGSGLTPAIRLRTDQLLAVENLVQENSHWASERAAARIIETQLSDFSGAAPLWTGLFKDLALLLPDDLRVVEFNCRSESGKVTLTIRAGVHPPKTGPSFDEIVGQTLLLLHRSAFSKRVELVSANRGQFPEDATAEGMVSVSVDIQYPAPREKARA